ncbi:DUF2845 domain-containing protein [Stutzerimonas xanthomarina]|uniref:DUF2845 domain-containing protein n=2 Tax=Stutzerimonas xanthomarina TaxID=271420 RepID=A0A1M5QQL3_9GAMM|nr:DUF2845 domain-containing protein [Stutzerimonas xanthomarina]MCP9338443.1 DUF2845 domain-containing protein [Stutzerimonas xanthomarina]SEH68837.1 Protein of unknown function [Stutzerimonas xanthomarina]SHH16385.1 Protein of unknown function [Stutzerimonas xanthomarina DSM 18231]
MRNRAVLAALTFALCVPHVQASSTFRCASKLVSLHDSTAEVQAKCGEPTSRALTGYRELVDEYGFGHEVQIEEWTYGPTNGMYHFLRFEGNRLRNIDSERG